MTSPTPEQIAKLPKWAQEYVERLQREREQAINKLNETLDEQTPSPFKIVDPVCTGEKAGPSFKTRYVQTQRIECTWAGVCVTVYCADDCIELQWQDAERLGYHVAMVPHCFQMVKLYSSQNMFRAED